MQIILQSFNFTDQQYGFRAEEITFCQQAIPGNGVTVRNFIISPYQPIMVIFRN